ncbi:hypothetical protein Sjap_019087 [Stephania japonica]|uniref:Uncharacterized protein n=1 Tax=Stephania japonica TaxID=461633 RepID=A0AAP0HUE5_9MAGN
MFYNTHSSVHVVLNFSLFFYDYFMSAKCLTKFLNELNNSIGPPSSLVVRIIVSLQIA